MLSFPRTDSQEIYGGGYYTGGGETFQRVLNGVNDYKGQFYGKRVGTNYTVTTFFIEHYYGLARKLVLGLAVSKGRYLVKMTPNDIDGSSITNYILQNDNYNGYVDAGVDVIDNDGKGAYIKEMALIQHKGLIPKIMSNASASTYYCDELVTNSSANYPLRYSGSSNYNLAVGIFYYNFRYNATNSDGNDVVCLSYK